MNNILIGYELFIDTELYPMGFNSSWNHKLYTTEKDAKTALKDFKNYIGKSLLVCYRPVFLCKNCTGKFVLIYNYVLQYKGHNTHFKSNLRKRIYSRKGIEDYKLSIKHILKFDFSERYTIHNIKYGNPIF